MKMAHCFYSESPKRFISVSRIGRTGQLQKVEKARVATKNVFPNRLGFPCRKNADRDLEAKPKSMQSKRRQLQSAANLRKKTFFTILKTL